MRIGNFNPLHADLLDGHRLPLVVRFQGGIAPKRRQLASIRTLHRWIVATIAAFLARHIILADSPFSVSTSLIETAPGRGVLAVSITIPAGHYLYASQLVVSASAPTELKLQEKPKTKAKHDPFADAPVEVYESGVITLTYEIKYDPTSPGELTVTYQGCSDTVCFLPETHKFPLQPKVGSAHTAKSGASPTIPSANTADPFQDFTLVASGGGYLTPRDFLAFLDRAESERAHTKDVLNGALRRRRMWVALVLIVLGGLALNLTPCVLPMIPINLMLIGAGAQAGSRLRGFVLGASYGAGIAVAYGLLGLLVVLTGSQFGAINASPWFNLVISAIFLLLALAVFDVIKIDLSSLLGNATGRLPSRRGFLAAFTAGGLSAILAGACVAPVVISVLVLAADLHARGNPTGLFLPFLLGFGMALPWPFAGAGLSFLPKPGKWLVGVKAIFGTIILVLAIGYLVHGIRGLTTRPKADVSPLAGAAPNRIGQQEWLTSVEEAAARSRAEQRLLFVDFWASWCKNCLAMDKTTLRHPEVQARLERYVRLKYSAEDPSKPETRRILGRMKVIGLPAYVILRPPTNSVETVGTLKGEE